MADWLEGKEINPELQKAIDEHLDVMHYGCMKVARQISWSSKKAHTAWRKATENHLGFKLPPSFLNEEPKPKINRNVSRIQGNPINDIITRDKD
jgi:hypothetical protein